MAILSSIFDGSDTGSDESSPQVLQPMDDGGSSVVDEDAPPGTAEPEPVIVTDGGFQMPTDPVE